jgi:hypothetical protein
MMGVYYSHYLIPRDNTVRPQPDQVVALIDAWIEKEFVAYPDDIRQQNQPATIRGRPIARFATEDSYAACNLLREQTPKPRQGFLARLLGLTPPWSPPPDPFMPFLVPPEGDSLAALAAPYALIHWRANPKATYPLQTISREISKDDFGFYPDLNIELSDDFINPNTDNYGGRDGDARQVQPICSCGHDLHYDGPAGCLGTDRIRRVCPACGQDFRPQDRPAEIRNGEDGTISVQPGGLCNRFGIIIDFGKMAPMYRPDSKGDFVYATPKVTSLFLQTCITALGIELNEFGYYG